MGIGRDTVSGAVRKVLGDSAELYTDALDRFGFREGAGHAEGYVAGYLETHEGSILDRIGVSHPEGICSTCFSGLGRLM